MEFLGFLSGVITAFLLFKVIFSGKDDFFDCVKFWFTPDIVSMFRGDYWDDHWAEFKLIIWLAVSFAVGYGVSSL